MSGSSGAAGHEERGERWWPAASAIVAVAALHVSLPARYRVNPVWLLPAVLLSLVALLVIGDPGQIDRENRWLRIVRALVIVSITLANLAAAIRLVSDILTDNSVFAKSPGGLLAAGAVVWLTNIVAFSLWYWDLDRGGPAARAHPPTRAPAFVFPEMNMAEFLTAPWTPRYVDYLSLGFWTATAFSPTDVSAITSWAKLLMMLEAMTSLGVATLVVSRAINVL